MSRKMLVLNVAALSPAAVATHAPNLRQLAATGSVRPLKAPFPSVTCSSHATMLTGELPQSHGIVGNGWCDREHAKVFMWNRSSRLVAGEPIWEAARKREPSLRCANLFWRFCADSSCDVIVTERPAYWASGQKAFDFYTHPSSLHDELASRLDAFPFLQFWGPLAGTTIASARWIIDAALHVMQTDKPELLLVYAPYLDYDAERYGPETPQGIAAIRAFDSEVLRLLDAARADQRDIAVVSDYGFTPVESPVFINQALRRAGLLRVQPAQNGERLEPGMARAFAVCDNQIAHVYVNDREDLPRVRKLLEELDGVAEVLDEVGKARQSIAHPRAGDLIAVADQQRWFAYRYWLDEKAAPDFAQCMAIFDKVGCDPTELFMRPGLAGRARFALRLAQKKLGLAVPFDACSGDPSLIRSARNVHARDSAHGAVLITSWPDAEQTPLPMEDLKSMLLQRMFERDARSVYTLRNAG